MTLVSFDREFIFIKTVKTAGTSLEVHLSEDCGPSDIVTPIFPENSRHRPRNYERPEIGVKFYNHMPAVEIRSALPVEFDKFYCFCFERHPVDKCLSHYAMLKNSPFHQREDNPKTWDEYVERGRFPVSTRLYTDGKGDLIVDRIYKYEELDQALADIAAVTGIRKRPLTVWEKSGFRVGVPTVEEVLSNPGQRNRIFDRFGPMMRFVAYD